MASGLNLVITNQPNTAITNQPTAGIKVPWKNTLFGSCSNAGTGFCLATTFCPQFAICWFSTYTGEDLCIPCCLGPAVTLTNARQTLRAKHGLEGCLADDCFPLLCCTPCFMCQTKAEWDLYEGSKLT